MEVQIFFPAYTTPFIYKYILLEIDKRPIVAVIPHENNPEYKGSFMPSFAKYLIDADLRHYAYLLPNLRVAVILMGAAGHTVESIIKTYRERMTAFPNATFLVDVGKNDDLIDPLKTSGLDRLFPLNDQTGILLSIINTLKGFKPLENPYAQNGD